MRRAGLRQPLPPRLYRIRRQAALDGPVGHRSDPGLLQDPDAVQLADGLDDPGQHQVTEHLIPAGRGLEPEHPVGALKRVEQAAHPGRGDRQGTAGRRLQPQVKLRLPCSYPLARRRLQRLQPRVVVRRPQVLDLP